MKILTIFSMSLTTLFLHAGALPDVIWQTDPQPHGVIDVGISADGQRIVSASVAAKLWDTNGALIREFVIPNDDVACVAISRDGLRLAAGGGSGGFRLWRISDGGVLFSGRAGSFGFYDLAFSSDSNLLAVAYNQTVTLANPTNSLLVGELEEVHSGLINTIAFSPNTTFAGSAGNDSRAALYRVSNGSLIQDFVGRESGGEEIPGHPGAVAFTPDEKHFVFGNADGTSSFWDLQTNGIARVFPGWGSAARFSPDGQLLLTITGGILKFWRVADGQLLVSYDAVVNVRCIDISPDGKLFAYGGANLVLARMPLFITKCTLNGGQAVLGWTGGSGLYQLQSRTNLLNDSWQNVGAATTNTTSTNVTSGTMFYRVQSVSNP